MRFSSYYLFDSHRLWIELSQESKRRISLFTGPLFKILIAAKPKSWHAHVWNGDWLCPCQIKPLLVFVRNYAANLLLFFCRHKINSAITWPIVITRANRLVPLAQILQQNLELFFQFPAFYKRNPFKWNKIIIPQISKRNQFKIKCHHKFFLSLLECDFDVITNDFCRSSRVILKSVLPNVITDRLPLLKGDFDVITDVFCRSSRLFLKSWWPNVMTYGQPHRQTFWSIGCRNIGHSASG